jgi:hypothetical protein
LSIVQWIGSSFGGTSSSSGAGRSEVLMSQKIGKIIASPPRISRAITIQRPMR